MIESTRASLNPIIDWLSYENLAISGKLNLKKIIKSTACLNIHSCFTNVIPLSPLHM